MKNYEGLFTCVSAGVDFNHTVSRRRVKHIRSSVFTLGPQWKVWSVRLGVPAQSAQDSEAASTQRVLIAPFIWQQLRAKEANKGRHVIVFSGRETIKKLFFMQMREYFVLLPKPECIGTKQMNDLLEEHVAAFVDNTWTPSNLNDWSAYLMTVRSVLQLVKPVYLR